MKANREIPSWREVEAGSGERPAIRSGIRVSNKLPKLWNEEDEDGEVTGPTNVNPFGQRTAQRASLTVMTGLHAGEVIALEGDGMRVLGRSRTSDIVVDDTGVSRLHCRMNVAGDIVTLEDLDSRNGTFVNGTPIVGTVRLASGDRVSIGEAVLQLGFVDETEETLARKLFEDSTRDPLTRAYNRRYFKARLESELSYARRHGTGLGVLLLDLDHFKKINDTHGHLAGDALLRAVVHELEQTVRAEDVLTRYGGEEFAILARVDSPSELERFGERVRARVEAARTSFEGRTLSVTVSIGVAELSESSHGMDGDELLGAADRRLYRAKLLGRNRVCAG